MKYRYSILLLVDSTAEDRYTDRDRFPYPPGSRKQNYLELLTGYGMPVDVADVSEIDESGLTNGDVIRYSSIILTMTLLLLEVGFIGIMTQDH